MSSREDKTEAPTPKRKADARKKGNRPKSPDLAGWLRLVNAYAVLDRKEDARTALAEARRHFAADEKALSQLAALAKTLDLGS